MPTFPLRRALLLASALVGSVLSAPDTLAAPPDSPPDYETLTTGLGLGVLYEPVLGAGPETNISDRYVTSYGDEIERRGFRTVRLRIAMENFSANATGTYPNLQLNSTFFTDLKAVVDDLLRRHNHTMYVLISPNGLESGSADDERQMVSYWTQIAGQFKDYTHRLIFNLMNEPYFRTGEFTSLAQIQSLYDAATDAIRASNPTRYLVYYQLNNVTIRSDGTRNEDTAYSNSGPGETDFIHLRIPASAGRQFIVDFHGLGNEDAGGTAKRFALLRQAFEYRAVTGNMVWSGAWNWGAWDTAFDRAELTKVADEMKRLGLPGTYLMFNSSNTSLFDGNGTDRDGDGVLNEWTRAADADLVVARNPIFWQKNQIHPVTSYRAEADAYVKGGTFTAEALSGEVQDLQVRNIRTSYLRFNVNRLPAGSITSAKLRLRTFSTTDVGTVAVHLASANNWTERTISWDNAPANGPALDSKTITTADTVVEWDVTAAVTASGLHTFVLKLGAGTTNPATPMRFYSRDCDRDPSWLYGPELIVTVTPTATANNAPRFTASALTAAGATVATAYSHNLAASTSDADSDTLRFGKSTGPTWLTVAQDGSLSGTPGVSDIGANSWSIEVSDGKGGTATATLNIAVAAASAATAPSISAQPLSTSVATGGTATFSVTATGNPAPTYQWLKAGTTLSGATNASLTITNAQASDAASYTVTVTNSAGSVTSSAATLTVNPASVAPTISTHPASQTVTAGNSATFTVVATGTPAPTYQWSKAGTALSGATGASLTLANVQSSDAASYTVTLTNSAGSITSSAATLTVNPSPATSAYAHRVTVGASRTWSPDAIGFNGQTQFINLRDNPFSNVNNVNILSRSMINFLRYPGGTVSNYWDWLNGRQIGSTLGDYKLANFKLAYDAVGFTPHFVVNMLTPTTSTPAARLNSALDMLTAAQTAGLPVTHIELGNEFYLGDADYVAAFPTGTAYGAMCQTWIAAIKARFPAAKCAIVVTMETRARLNTWSAEALAACTNYDALVVHWYADSGHEPTVPEGNGTAAEQGSQWALFSGADGVTTMLAQPNRDWSALVAGNNLPADKEIWVTEFNLKDSNAAVRQTWAHGIFVANQFHALLRDSRIRRLAPHNWAGGNKQLNYTTATELDIVLTPHTQGSLATTPYQFAAPGFAARMFAEVADTATALAPLAIEYSPEVTATGITSYPAVYGWRFTTPGGVNRAIFVNSSARAYDVYLGGVVSTASRLRQVSGNPRTYVTGENATLLRRVSTDTPTTLRLPAYSITTIGALADVASTTSSPGLPAFTSAALTKPAATAFRYYEQSLTADAADADGGTLTFRKASGPAWLTVWDNGTIAGLPDNSHVGANTFTVEAVDPAGHVARATLQIAVTAGTPPSAPALPAQSVAPSADTFIYSGAQAAIAQTLDGFLDVRSTTSATFARVPYLKFTVSNLPGTIASAVLNIFSVGVNSSVTVYSTGTTWSASTLTWDNRPDAPNHGTVVATKAIVPGWNQIDLSSIVTAAGTYSFALNESSNTLQQFHSSRGANPPYLALTFATPTATYTAPAITVQPANRNAETGGSATFSVTASGVPTATYQWLKAGAEISGATGSTLTLTNIQAGDAGQYSVRVANPAGAVTSSTATLAVASSGTAPAFTSQPVSQAVTLGAAVSFTAAASGSPAPTYQWYRNGSAVSGATNATLALAQTTASDAGTYTVVATNALGTATSSAAVLGLSITTRSSGSTAEVGANIVHPNGNTYDQFLLDGATALLRSDANQITRISFIDLTDDIVQVEFSGAGTLQLTLESPTGPATPVKYNQAVSYMRGHARITLSGADATTHLSVFSVGRITAVNQALFSAATTYDGHADIASITITSPTGQFGGLRTANTTYFATAGPTGVLAPGITFNGPVFVGDINASSDASPVLLLGSAADVRITGGDLLQANNRPVAISGITQLKFVAGQDSHGNNLAVQTNRARLERDGVDVTTSIVTYP